MISNKYIAIKSLRGAESTIIDCLGKSRALMLRKDRSFIVGLTYRNGYANHNNQNVRYPEGPGMGGALYVVENAIQGMGTTIVDCIITNNHASKRGGGIYLGQTALMKLENVRITSNVCDEHGGGMTIDNSIALFKRASTISRNVATYGGGIVISATGLAAEVHNVLSLITMLATVVVTSILLVNVLLRTLLQLVDMPC